MSSTSSKLQHRTWTNNKYLITTDPSLIPITILNEAFASEDVYWATPLPEHVMREMLQNSLCFGLYELDRNESTAAAGASESMPSFIGIARCITDFTTFVYLTDVYIDPLYQGKGLGTWLVSCVQEVVESMPYLRRSLLFTGDWKRSVPFYEKVMGMTVLECKKGENGKSGQGLAVLMRRGKGDPTLNVNATH